MGVGDGGGSTSTKLFVMYIEGLVCIFCKVARQY